LEFHYHLLATVAHHFGALRYCYLFFST